MATKVPAALEQSIERWQEAVSELLGQSVALSLFYIGVNHCLLRVNEQGMLRIPLSRQNSSQPLAQLYRRMEIFAQQGHCVKGQRSFTRKELPPYGGILVSFQAGRPVSLPADLPLLAHCFAALHSSAKTSTAYKPDILQLIVTREPLLAQAPVEEESRQLIRSFFARLPEPSAFAENMARLSDVPVLWDAHPGNFVIADEKAMVVDLEGDFLHSAAVDLAHLTLFSSLLWFDKKAEPLATTDILSFYRAYLRLMKDHHYKSLSQFIALRHIVLCRTLSWMFRFLCYGAQGLFEPPIDMLEKAHNILRAGNLDKLRMNEEELLSL